MNDERYNPLDKLNLGRSVVNALLEQPVRSLKSVRRFAGAGVYAIYYTGDHDLYRAIARRNQDGRFDLPIYVGKAIPEGARGGGLGVADVRTAALARRLSEHATSIGETDNLSVDDFWFRSLVVDDIWIPLGESLLIQTFGPAW